YLNFDRSIIQFEPGSGRYDPELFYTLRPGISIFSNREFRTDYFVNRLGLRDTDADLVGPDMIVLGDSYAMGWGVNQAQTLPELIQTKTGMRVLNAGISSFD